MVFMLFCLYGKLFNVLVSLSMSKNIMMNDDVVQFLQVLSCSLLNGCKLISKQELMTRSWPDGEKLPKEGKGKETVIDNRTIVTVVLIFLLGMEATIFLCILCPFFVA